MLSNDGRLPRHRGQQDRRVILVNLKEAGRQKVEVVLPVHVAALVDQLGNIPFPKKAHDEIVAAGRPQQHHILPDTGWVNFYLSQQEMGSRLAVRQAVKAWIHRAIRCESQ